MGDLDRSSGSGGPLCTEFFERFDKVVAPALPAGWMATNVAGPAPLWVTSTAAPNSPPNSAFVDDPAVSSDKVLDTPGIFISSASVGCSSAIRSIWNVIQATSMMGPCWKFHRLTSTAERSPTSPMPQSAAVSSAAATYATISNCCGNPLAGRMAWGGRLGRLRECRGGPRTKRGGQTIKFRFRMASDSSVACHGVER